MGMELVHIYFANFEIDLFAQPTPSDVSTQPEGVSKLAESALCEIIWYFLNIHLHFEKYIIKGLSCFLKDQIPFQILNISLL